LLIRVLSQVRGPRCIIQALFGSAMCNVRGQ
jgi:hypothetical protein